MTYPPDPSLHADADIAARCPYCHPKLPPPPPPPPAPLPPGSHPNLVAARLLDDLRGFPQTHWGRKR